MSSALSFYKRLRDAGVDEATAILCAEQFDAEVKIAVDAILEPKRAKDRERKRSTPRNSTETPETAESAEAPPPPSFPPEPPKPPTPTRECDSSRTRKADDFERFWAAYPRKTAKDTARKAFPRALSRASVETMLAGIERQREWEQWRRGVIPHPATWLNQSRWNDELPEVQPAPRAPHDRPDPDAKQAARHANYARAFEGSLRASGQRWEP